MGQPCGFRQLSRCDKLCDSQIQFVSDSIQHRYYDNQTMETFLRSSDWIAVVFTCVLVITSVRTLKNITGKHTIILSKENETD